MEQGKRERLFDAWEGREIVSSREEHVKHFDLGAGRRQAVVFGEPVHYRDADGALREIDNTLEAVLESGRSLYRNRANSLIAEFPAQVDGGELARLTNKGRTLSWRFENAARQVSAQVKDGAALKRLDLLERAKAVRERAAARAGADKARLASKETLAEAIAQLGLDRAAGEVLARAEDLSALSTEQLDQALRTPAERRGSRIENSSELSYAEILPGITVKYRLESARVKEDIIAASEQALQSVALRLSGEFEYAVQENQSVKVLDEESGEELFTFAPPLAIDANGKQEIATVALEERPEGVRMTYLLSDAFLADAQYPVTIDPVVQASSANSAVEDTYIWVREGYQNRNFGDVYIMRSGLGEHGESISLVKFLKLPKQRASDTIINARLALYPEAYPSRNEYMACYPIKTQWTELGATWNSMTPENTDHISDEVISYITSTAYSPCYFDVTDLCRKWYRKDGAGNTQNFGVAIRYPQGVSGADKYVEWITAQKTSYPPKLFVDYVSHAGVKGWWQYERMPAGRAGTAHVDIYNGNMVYEHADVAMGGKRLPVSVGHVYNSCLSESNPSYCGMGWRTTANQSLHYAALGENNYYIWTDGDGTEHYFKKAGSQPYKDEEGMELKLTLNSNVATIRDKGDTAMAFPQPTDATKTYITSVTDACGNQMTYTYSPLHAGRVDKLTDGVGRETAFAYNGNNLLAGITNPDGRSVTFGYDGNARLTSIGYSDLQATQRTNFTYTGNLLVSATNYDGLKTTLTYEAASSYDEAAIEDFAEQARRVIAMEQTKGTAKGAKTKIEYLGMTTKVTAVEALTSDAGKTITYQFNSAGNVVCMFDELGYAQSATFSNTMANTPLSVSKLQRAVVNLAKNVAFDAGWTAVKGTSTDTAARDTGTKCLNMPSVKIVKSQGAETLYRQEAPISGTGDYTFSAYVKAENLTGGGVFARMKQGSAVYESIKVREGTQNSSCGPNAEGWERVQVTAELTATGTNPQVTLELVSAATGGTAWFACPQLERGKIANRVNLMKNGDFSRTVVNTGNSAGQRQFPEDWAAKAGVSTSLLNGVVTQGHGMPEVLTGNALRLTSAPGTGSVSFNQEIPVSGAKDDVYVLGGWANSRSVASGGENSAPSLAYRFYSGSSWSEWKFCEFNRGWVGWQFGCWAIAAPNTYKKLEVATHYSRNAQTAMFTNLYAHREQFGESFAYDEKKNLLSTSNLAEKKSSMTYDEYDNLLTYVRPGAAATEKYQMTYGSTTAEKKKHLALTSTTPMGMKASYTYDAYGNRLTTVNQKAAGEALMRTEAEYGADGNYLVKSKDARGNAVTRTLNADWTLAKVADPTGQEVEYGYDAAKRVTSVQTAAAGKTYKNAYTYENDRLKTVSHNTGSNTAQDVTYTFEYDDLGRKTTVKVGTQTLSTNVYASDRSGLLKEVRYGNGGKVKYAHDEFDRLTGVRYDSETTDRYAYEYGANGAASMVTDKHLNRTMETEYDLAERPMQSTLRDSAGNLLYRATLKYDVQNQLERFREQAGDEAYETSFAYDKDGRTTQVKYGADTRKVDYGYDTLGRISSRTVTNGTNAYASTYTFVAGGYGANSTTPLVSGITQGTGDSAMNFAYAYDTRGNITSETRNGKVTTYAYDALGQLIRVNDPNDTTSGNAGTTWVYEYDRGGNILNKKRYAYTTGTPGTVLDTIPYTYGDANWKDKLTAYDGQAITYDAIGNPLSDGTWTYQWQAGRQLKQMSKSGMSVQFAYDHNGLRTQKKVTANGVTTTTNYMLHGKLITHLTRGTDALHFYYDAQSKPAMVEFNGVMYTYVHNMQGDISSIVDNLGSIVVEYGYDAWGNPTSTRILKTACEALAELNPFRYRGYVWDEETGLYYLRTRYYRPVWGRFVNADNYISVKSCANSGNTYAYGNNCPVVWSDEDGMEATKAWKVTVVAYEPLEDGEWLGHYEMYIDGTVEIYGNEYTNVTVSYGPKSRKNMKGVLSLLAPEGVAYRNNIKYIGKGGGFTRYESQAFLVGEIEMGAMIKRFEDYTVDKPYNNKNGITQFYVENSRYKTYAVGKRDCLRAVNIFLLNDMKVPFVEDYIADNLGSYIPKTRPAKLALYFRETGEYKP